jgi:hypothetical protein
VGVCGLWDIVCLCVCWRRGGASPAAPRILFLAASCEGAGAGFQWEYDCRCACPMSVLVLIRGSHLAGLKSGLKEVRVEGCGGWTGPLHALSVNGC